MTTSVRLEAADKKGLDALVLGVSGSVAIRRQEEGSYIIAIL